MTWSSSSLMSVDAYDFAGPGSFFITGSPIVDLTGALLPPLRTSLSSSVTP